LGGGGVQKKGKEMDEKQTDIQVDDLNAKQIDTLKRAVKPFYRHIRKLQRVKLSVREKNIKQELQNIIKTL